MKNLVALMIFVFGVLTGVLLVRLDAPAPAIAQTAVPSPHEHSPAPGTVQSAMPMQTGMPTPMASGSAMPLPRQPGMPMQGMMMQMMPPPKSAADRAYMGAMMQMHGGMMRTSMTGNADHDFLTMMIPHHQAAVAMAQTELQYGRDAKVKALAKRIITAQQTEIRQMQSWLK